MAVHQFRFDGPRSPCSPLSTTEFLLRRLMCLQICWAESDLICEILTAHLVSSSESSLSFVTTLDRRLRDQRPLRAATQRSYAHTITAKPDRSNRHRRIRRRGAAQRRHEIPAPIAIAAGGTACLMVPRIQSTPHGAPKTRNGTHPRPRRMRIRRPPGASGNSRPFCLKGKNSS